MKKQISFSIDTSKGYFWIILALAIYILVISISGSESKLQIENSMLKGKNEILVSKELKIKDSILTLKQSLSAIRNDKIALESKLKNQKTRYKTLTIEKYAKKNTIDSYDHRQLSGFLPSRYKQD